MGVNALELEDLISEAEAWIDTIMKDTAISAQSLRDEAEVLPPPPLAHFPCAASAEPYGYAQAKQGLQGVDELAQGLATNAITLKVWDFPARAPAWPCWGPVLALTPPPCARKQQKAKLLLERSQDQGTDLPALVRPRARASPAASDAAARLLHGACTGAPGGAPGQASQPSTAAAPSC